MSDRDFLIWQDIAYQTEAHLLENGQRLPVETRMILAGIRDIARERGDAGRQALLDDQASGPEAVPTPEREVPVREVSVRDAPRSDTPRSDAPRSDAPRSDAPLSEAPAARPARPLAIALIALAMVLFVPFGAVRNPDPPLQPVALPPVPWAEVHLPADDPDPAGRTLTGLRTPPAALAVSAADPVPSARAVEPPLAANPLYAPAVEAALQLGRKDARTLQRALRETGQDLVADGVIGPETRAALAAWQAAKGVEATGHFTPEAVAALKAVPVAPARPQRTLRPQPVVAEVPAMRSGCLLDEAGHVAYGHGPSCDVAALRDRLAELLGGSVEAATLPEPRDPGR